MMTLDDQADLLDTTTWARGLSWPQIRSIVEYMHVTGIAPDETLVREGARDASLSVIAEGEVTVLKRDVDLVERLVVTLRRGSTFGEMSLLDGEPRSATVVASKKGLILTLTAEKLELLVAEKPRLAVEVFRRLGRMASQNLRRTSGRLVDSLSD